VTRRWLGARKGRLRLGIGSLDTGIARGSERTDAEQMIWPVAALAGGLLGFVFVYGSVVQSRLASSGDGRGRS
jgi:hypothetical protein